MPLHGYALPQRAFLIENDGLICVQEDTMIQVPPDGAR